MGKYLKLFETHAEYETYSGGEMILPNVSYCEDDKDIHYNPYIKPFFCKLKQNDGSIVEIEGSGELTSTMVSSYKNTTVSAEFGELCTSITNNSFFGWDYLTSVEIGDNITSIGELNFNHCGRLASIKIGKGLISLGRAVFANCTALESITIPDNVTSIGVEVFNGCSNLSSVTIGNGITSIGRQAFYTCLKLTSVTIKAIVPPTLDMFAFENNASGRKIYVPSESVDAYKAASRWSNYASDIEAIR